MPTTYYMAAFAAFLLHPHTRLPAALILAVELSCWRLESLDGNDFKLYYIIAGITSALAAQLLVKSHLLHSKLMFAVLCNAFLGYVLYVYYLPPAAYNFIGYCIIIVQLLILAKDASGGEFRRFFDDLIIRVRYNLHL